jgi:hypothetical protein
MHAEQRPDLADMMRGAAKKRANSQEEHHHSVASIEDHCSDAVVQPHLWSVVNCQDHLVAACRFQSLHALHKRRLKLDEGWQWHIG